MPDQFIGMTRERYTELVQNVGLTLTQDEVKAGWHFCYDWDWMLIHTSWEEFQDCSGCCSD